MAIAEALREEVEKQARQRARAGNARGGMGGEVEGNLPPTSKQPQTRDTLARRVGMSCRTYEKARAVVEAAKAEPEKFGDLQERMDRSRSVDGAFGGLQKRRDRERGVGTSLATAGVTMRWVQLSTERLV